MNQKNIGSFLKTLRKEKNLTQEQNSLRNSSMYRQGLFRDGKREAICPI